MAFGRPLLVGAGVLLKQPRLLWMTLAAIAGAALPVTVTPEVIALSPSTRPPALLAKPTVDLKVFPAHALLAWSPKST